MQLVYKDAYEDVFLPTNRTYMYMWEACHTDKPQEVLNSNWCEKAKGILSKPIIELVDSICRDGTDTPI